VCGDSPLMWEAHHVRRFSPNVGGAPCAAILRDCRGTRCPSHAGADCRGTRCPSHIGVQCPFRAKRIADGHIESPVASSVHSVSAAIFAKQRSTHSASPTTHAGRFSIFLILCRFNYFSSFKSIYPKFMPRLPIPRISSLLVPGVNISVTLPVFFCDQLFTSSLTETPVRTPINGQQIHRGFG